MITKELKLIIENVQELCELIEGKVDYISEMNGSLAEICKNDMISYLGCLAVADDVVVMQEIKFINELFDTSFNLLEIKKMGRDYDATGAYVVPVVIEKACEFDLNNEYTEMNAAQTIVNAFYYLGIEFVACDDEVAFSEIKRLTELISNYQDYLKEAEISGEMFDIIEDLQIRKYLQQRGEDNIFVAPEKEPAKIELYDRNNELNLLISKLDDAIFTKVKNNLIVLINNVRIRNIRRQRGLKNSDLPKTMILFGGKNYEIEAISKVLSELFSIEGITEESFVTRFTCSYNTNNPDRIVQFLDMSKCGNMLVLQADGLSRGEIDEILSSVKENEHQAIFLSGDTNKLISFLEKNRQINPKFNRSLYLDGLNEELICDIFEYLCVENDYKLSRKAKEELLSHFRDNQEKFDSYYLFQIFDRIVEYQNQRILSEKEMDEEKMVTIMDVDIAKGIV